MAALQLITRLSQLPLDSHRDEVWEHIRDNVHVGVFGARPGFGNGEKGNEHRFRIDDHWPEPKPKQPWDD